MTCKHIHLPEGAHAIMCGHKDHECDDKGPVIYLLKDGSRVGEKEAHDGDRLKDSVIGGSVTCSICGGAAIDDAPYF